MRQALRNRAVQGLEEKARSSEKKVDLVAGIEGFDQKKHNCIFQHAVLVNGIWILL